MMHHINISHILIKSLSLRLRAFSYFKWYFKYLFIFRILEPSIWLSGPAKIDTFLGSLNDSGFKDFPLDYNFTWKFSQETLEEDLLINFNLVLV